MPGSALRRGDVLALYLDDDRQRALFDGRDVEGVRALADQAAIAIRQMRDRREIEELNGRLRERVEFQGRELASAHAALRRRGETAPFGGLVGDSEPMRRLRATIERLAPTDLSILVTGPSGRIDDAFRITADVTDDEVELGDRNGNRVVHVGPGSGAEDLLHLAAELGG